MSKPSERLSKRRQAQPRLEFSSFVGALRFDLPSTKCATRDVFTRGYWLNVITPFSWFRSPAPRSFRQIDLTIFFLSPFEGEKTKKVLPLQTILRVGHWCCALVIEIHFCYRSLDVFCKSWRWQSSTYINNAHIDDAAHFHYGPTEKAIRELGSKLYQFSWINLRSNV